MPNEPSLIGTTEASRILKRHPATVTRYAESGRLRVVGRLSGENGALIFTEADVLKLREELVAEGAA